MSRRSPGHRKWPDHQVREQRVDGRVRVEVNGEVLADSSDVIRVDEDGNPPRYYFPRTDVRMDWLEPVDKPTECPFKGTGRYFALNTGGRTLADAAWSYEDTYEEHMALKDRIAFYTDKVQEVELRIAA
jgi:uncharacterized protein (DUF427 family)